MNKPKLIFIDHSFHKKTGSVNFLRDILSAKFNITNIWDESWADGKPISASEINMLDPAIVIYFQSIGKISEIKKIHSKNIIWVPMEGEYFNRKSTWLNYKKINLKILCFSKEIFSTVSKLGFDTLYVQYFIEPKKQRKDFSELKVYFWQRHKSVDWNVVKKLLGSQKIESLFFRNLPDPFMDRLPLPSKQDIKRYNINISDKWLDRSEMNNILSDFNIFIAPRKHEGIGMAFLEAMAYGMVVIAPDTLTHNEYIKSGFNGYLYDLNDPKPINFSNLKDVSNNSRKAAFDGYNKWRESQNKIIDFINKKSETAPLNRKEKIVLLENIFYDPPLMAVRLIKNIIKIIVR